MGRNKEMKRLIVVYTSVVFLLAAFCLLLPTCNSNDDKVQASIEGTNIAAGNNAFACDVYGKLRETESGNFFFSPFSIRTALAMTYAGARGATAGQMAEVLHFGEGQEALHAEMGAYIKKLNASAGPDTYLLTVANALWGQEGLEFIPEFLQLNDTYYGAGLKTVDFSGDTEGARRTINQWVEEKTNEKIKDLILKDDLTSLTRLVLTNAIYFLGAWQEQFNSDITRPGPFTVEPGTTVEVPFMFQKERFWYAEYETLQVLEMRYKGGNLGMAVILPREPDGLAGFEEKLNADVLKELLGSLRGREVMVYFPKFKIESRFSLRQMLMRLGMGDAFHEERADFTGMTADERLHISDVIHKTYVDVNEEGTEAAAATAVIMGTKMAELHEEPPTFRADHPFIFLIRDVDTGTILFMGRLTEPK
jgi:serpin B